jgi:hypothetical protein
MKLVQREGSAIVTSHKRQRQIQLSVPSFRDKFIASKLNAVQLMYLLGQHLPPVVLRERGLGVPLHKYMLWLAYCLATDDVIA